MSSSDPFTHQSFSAEDITRLQPAMKVGILATVTPQGLPHLTLISTLMASAPTELVWGQFIEGSSKANIRANPKAGFLIMTLDKVLWRGLANFTHTAREGQAYDFYNNTPLFRYNAYFGIHTVFYMDLLAHCGAQPLPMSRVALAGVQTLLARRLPRKKSEQTVMNPWTRALFDKLDNLKFISYVRADGYPVIIPAIQTQCLDASHLIFSFGAYGADLAEIPPGAPISVFGMALTMEDALVRGKYLGARRMWGLRCGIVALDWAYNPMPPVPMQIYPSIEIEPVIQFD